MRSTIGLCCRGVLGFVVFSGLAALPQTAGAADYKPITPTMTNKTITLTGRDLTIENVIEVARYGAQVKFSPEAIKRAGDGRGLRLQAGIENIPVYGLNRGAGALREQTRAEANNSLAGARNGSRGGALPEVSEEELTRAIILTRANTVPYNAATPEYMQMLTDLLNKRVTPVFYSRGTLGEGDGPVTGNISATMVGSGDAYYQGVRMKASEALKKAGLKPLSTETGGGTSVAYGTALASLLVYDGRQVLEWADLINAMNKLGMNSSLTPMASPVQAKRPFKWVNWDAARTLDILRGSYLFEDDSKRILQDPESARASYIRQGSAWQAWAALRDDVLLQINAGEQNPAIMVGVSPQDSWELATPQMMKYYVKGGEASKGMHGYVMSNANWDPYPMANQVEGFVNALANAGAAIAQRIERYTDRGPTAFFTGIKPADVLTPDQVAKSPSLSEPYFVFMDLWAEIQFLSRPVTPEGNALDLGVADIEAFTRLKGSHGREVVDLMMQLLGYDFLMSTYWMDVRKAEDPKRNFGAAPTAVLTAFRKVLPWQKDRDSREEVPFGVIAYHFLKDNPASSFYPGGPAMPSTDGQRNKALEGKGGQ